MLAALAGEGLARPPVPALAQPQPGELGHQVELGRPHIPERDRPVLAAAVGDLDVVRAHRLRGDVVDVERPLRRAHVERHHVLPGRQPPQLGHVNLDDEAAAGLQVSRDVAEARHLRLLCRQVHDRVEDQVGDGERPVHPGGGEIADCHADRVAAGLGAQPGDHRPRHVDAVDRNAAARQRQGDAPGPDAQLQCAAAARELGQNAGHRVHHARLEHLRGRIVVGRRDAFPEVAVLFVHRPTVPRNARVRSVAGSGGQRKGGRGG